MTRQRQINGSLALLVGELVSGVSSHLLLLNLTEVPLVEHEVPQLDGGPEEVERDEETEGSSSIGQLAVESNGVEILHPQKLLNHLT